MAEGEHGGNEPLVVRPNRCITPGCQNDRETPLWYCKPCTDEFKAEQDRRRGGSVGSYPNQHKKQKPYGDERESWPDVKAGSVWSSKENRWVSPSHGGITSTNLGTGSGSMGGINLGVTAAKHGTPCDHKGGHDGSTPAITLADGRCLYGAQGARLGHSAAVGHLDLIVDCAGMVKADPFVARASNPRYRRLNLIAFPDVIRLTWPDMSAPVHVGIRFWERLYELLPKHTCVCCVGGHGRTGTALACVLVAGGMDPDKAIVEVREKHCARAIETPGQEAYIRGLRS